MATGVNEIVLTGVNIGDFGRKNNETFFNLLTELDKIEIPRIRLSSVEPDLLSDDLIEFISRSSHFMPHFHIPLQSGSDKILKSMKRRYLTENYQSRIQKIRSLLPAACIASDVIVGFPGETDDDFAATYHFIESLDISYLHVFTYSCRDNTLAARMQDPVASKIKKERSDLLHELSDKKKKRFYLNNRGRDASVLFESDNSNGYMHGFTENYLKVKTLFDPGYSNRILSVRLDNLDSDLTYIISMKNVN
jgi:threonylcarbamoyladenosine tRNA methylthiotransferase MtaB